MVGMGILCMSDKHLCYLIIFPVLVNPKWRSFSTSPVLLMTHTSRMVHGPRRVLEVGTIKSIKSGVEILYYYREASTPSILSLYNYAIDAYRSSSVSYSRIFGVV